jgi:hypothetical protein
MPAAGTQFAVGTDMSNDAGAILRRQRARRFAGLAGSSVDATLPLRQSLLDELVARAVARYPQAELDVRLRDGNLLEVRAGWRIFGFPARWRLPFRIEPHANLAERPILHVRLAETSAAWSAARRAVGGLGLLPAFVRLSDEGVAIDVQQLALQRGMADLLPIVRALSFDGREGILWMRVEAEVPSPTAEVPPEAPASAPPAEQPAGGSDRVPRDPAALIAHLAGARATVTLKISEPLANELLDAGLDRARTAPASGPHHATDKAAPYDVQRLLGWCRALRIGFEPGAVSLVAEVVVEAPATAT